MQLAIAFGHCFRFSFSEKLALNFINIYTTCNKKSQLIKITKVLLLISCARLSAFFPTQSVWSKQISQTTPLFKALDLATTQEMINYILTFSTSKFTQIGVIRGINVLNEKKNHNLMEYQIKITQTDNLIKYSTFLVLFSLFKTVHLLIFEYTHSLSTE